MFTLQQAFDLVTKKTDGFPYSRKKISDLGKFWAFHYDGSLGVMIGFPSPALFEKETGKVTYPLYPEIADKLNMAPTVSIP